MIKSTVEKMADPIGFEIGASDDVTQATLLNGFCRGLSNSMTNDHNTELQICYIVEKLDLNAEEGLLSIAELVKEKQKNRK